MAQNLEDHLTAQNEQSRRLFWHRLRLDAVEKHLPRGSFTLLDIGAGAGHLGEFLHSARPEASYAFIEPISSLRTRLRARHGTAADFAGRPRLDDVTCVALLDVLEHQEDEVDFLRSFADRLPRGCRLIITVPALSALWSAWDVGLGHFRRYRARSLRAVLERSDLRVQRINYLFPELLPTAIYRRLRSPAGKSSGTQLDLEFPMPHPIVNESLYQLGSITQRFQRFHLIGTSLIAVAIKR